MRIIHTRVRGVLLTTAALWGLGPGMVAAQPSKQTVVAAVAAPQPPNEELLRNLQCMEQRLGALEAKLKAQSAISPGAASIEGAQPSEPPKPFPMRIVRVPQDENHSVAPQAVENASSIMQAPAKKEKVAGTAPVDPCTPKQPATASAPLLPPMPTITEQPLLPPLPGAASVKPASTERGKKGILGVAESPIPGLSIGAYGEIKFGSMQNPDATGQWQNGFDAHRLVLLPTYAITPNIIFNAEIEFEHGGIAFDSDEKLHGSVDVEQIFVDFLVTDWLNWRSPGLDLVPIGYINQHHEPTQFYSVKRPELYNGLIPSTWRVPASSIYGTLADGIKYQLQISSSLEDFGDDFGVRTAANAVPTVDPVTGLAIPYAAGITGLEALGLARPAVGDFRQLSNVIAYAGKLDFTPPFLTGLGWSVSAYYSPNTTPRGAHDNLGNPLGQSSLTMFDAEFRYRVPHTWVELRGEYVRANFGSPVNLRANNDGDPTNNVGRFMYGYSGEIAFHIPLGTILNSEWKLVPFYRYTYQNLQAVAYGQVTGVGGTELSLPTGAGQMRFQDFGFALFPSPNIVLKATYQRVRNNDPLGAQADSILGGVGFFF